MHIRRRSNSPLSIFLTSVIFMIVGAVFIAVATGFYLDNQQFLVGAVGTTGEITQCRFSSSSSSRRSSSSDSCRPTVSFTTQSGQKVTFTNGVSSDSFHVGDSVQVHYHPDNPSNARISDFFSLGFLPLLFGGLGSLFFLVGFMIIIFFVRGVMKKRSQPAFSSANSYNPYNNPYK